MEKWEEGYYITAVAGSDNLSSLVSKAAVGLCGDVLAGSECVKHTCTASWSALNTVLRPELAPAPI